MTNPLEHWDAQRTRAAPHVAADFDKGVIVQPDPPPGGGWEPIAFDTVQRPSDEAIVLYVTWRRRFPPIARSS